MEGMKFEGRAQTNVQLYLEMSRVGRSARDIATVRDAYTLAAELFAGQLRPEGRPFTCHLVGVASILATMGAPLVTVAGGLMHSAYTHGDFGMGRGEMRPAARGRLRKLLGDEIEGLAAGYASLPWNPASVGRWLADVDAIADGTRPLIVIRLANALEDALDLGLHFSGKFENPNRAIDPEQLAALAEAVGCPGLGPSLRRALDECQNAGDLAQLRAAHDGSYVVGPPSWREKLFPRLARYARRLRDGG